jgi:uncharacterized membrane protein YccC
LTGILDVIRTRQAEIRLALRATVAAVLAFALARLLELPQGYWAVITAILVMQTSVGASLKAALDRLGGTLAGAIFGACISLLIPHASQLGLGLAIALAMAPMTLLAAMNASFKVAPVTALIVLLPTAGNIAPPLVYALDRILEIALGNIVGMTVALLVLPARAHNLLVGAAANVARLNAELMAALIDGLITGQGRPGLPALHAKIRAALKQAEAAADEAARERRSHLSDMPDPEPLVRTLYRIRHDLVMIGRAASKPLADNLAQSFIPRIADLRDAAIERLRLLAEGLLSGTPTSPADAFDTSLRAFVADIDAIARRPDWPYAEKDSSRMLTLKFAFEQLAQDLGDLGKRSDEIAKQSTP